MARSKHFPSRRTSGSSRQTTWSLGPSGETGVISTSVSALFSVGAQALEDGLTIVRTHGEVLASLLTGTGTGDGYECAVGICIVSENAAAVGITAVPMSMMDIGWDGWFAHKQFLVKTPVANELLNDSTMFRWDIDSKAMRKIRETDVVLGVVEVAKLGTATLQLTLRSRLLAKLS